MQKIKHPYFGQLVVDKDFSLDAVWEGKIESDNRSIVVSLWLDGKETIDIRKLDAFAAFLTEFDSYEIKARDALIRYLKQNSDFIDYYADRPDILADVTSFVENLTISAVNLWHYFSGIIVDFMVEVETNNKIIAVKFDSDGEVEDISYI